ncbi:MAG: OmpA/MotB family protein [Oligoflexus sp.]
MAKKKKQEDEPLNQGWIVSYADLMTLLFCVFVVLYAMKPEGRGEGKNQMETMASMIREAFNEIPDDIPDVHSVEPTQESKTVFAFFKGDTSIQPIVKRYLRADKVVPVINEEMQETIDKIEIILKETKRPDIDPIPDKHRPISVLPDKDGFTVRLLTSYFFEKGEYKLKREAYEQVRRIGETLKELDKKLHVEGHTDSIPAHGRISNWELSTLRAGSVARLFIQELNFPSSQISTAGYADTRPIGNNRTEEGRRLNRRVEIKVEYNE